MLKKKLNSLTVQAGEKEIYLVGKNNIKIYPVKTGIKWFIEVDINGKITRFKKEIKEHEINDSVHSTIKFYYNKIINLKK